MTRTKIITCALVAAPLVLGLAGTAAASQKKADPPPAVGQLVKTVKTVVQAVCLAAPEYCNI